MLKRGRDAVVTGEAFFRNLLTDGVDTVVAFGDLDSGRLHACCGRCVSDGKSGLHNSTGFFKAHTSNDAENAAARQKFAILSS